MTRYLHFVALYFIACAPAFSDETAPGLVELHAIDAETGQGIPGIGFAKENSDAEVWGVPIGTTDENGVLRFVSVPESGYHYWIDSANGDRKVVSIDEVPSRIVPGKITKHRFVLRKRAKPDNLPPIASSSSVSDDALPEPIRTKNKARLESTVTDMPGFEGSRVRFSFYPDPVGQVSEQQLSLARHIYANGRRVRVAVLDELEWLHRTEGYADAKNDDLRDIQINIERSPKVVGKTRLWSFHCNVPAGMRLKQNGYRVFFWELDRWDLNVPDFLQSASTVRSSSRVEEWTVAKPISASTEPSSDVQISDDQSIEINPPTGTHAQELALKFQFDKPTAISRLKLEVLPDLRQNDRRLGTDPKKRLLLFEVAASLHTENEDRRILRWAHCWSPQDPTSEFVEDCIDSLADSGYEIPPLTKNESRKELFLTLEKPIAVVGSAGLEVVIETGGSREFDVFNRLRVSFCH